VENIFIYRLYRFTALLPVLLTSCTLFSQHYEIGRMEADFIDHSREGRLIKALILYPADSAGSDLPLARPALGGFPVIVFGHGYMMPVEAYRNIWEFTVPEGFVFVLPRSGSKMFPSHLEFGLDMAFILDEMIRLNGDSTSLFSGSLQPFGCLMGHSMGGGAALLGAPESNSLKTLLVLAPLDTRPSSAKAAREISVPSLVFAGSDDYITPPEKHQMPIYDSLQSPQKTYICIQGGSHCQMASNYRLCNFAEASFNLEPGITIQEQHRILKRYMLPWLEFYLYNDLAAGREFQQQLESDPAISYKTKGSLSIENW
jgi:predicted dienelactone hydrolase